jgi:hypothetical protein
MNMNSLKKIRHKWFMFDKAKRLLKKKKGLVQMLIWNALNIKRSFKT